MLGVGWVRLYWVWVGLGWVGLDVGVSPAGRRLDVRSSLVRERTHHKLGELHSSHSACDEEIGDDEMMGGEGEVGKWGERDGGQDQRV